MAKETSDGIIIISKGLDGDTSYSVINRKNQGVIIPWLGIKKFSEKFISTYPEISKQIDVYCKRSFSGTLPEDVDMPKEPSHSGRLIESISSQFT